MLVSGLVGCCNNPSPRVCMSIHAEGESWSDLGRVLVLSDPPARTITSRGIVHRYKISCGSSSGAGSRRTRT